MYSITKRKRARRLANKLLRQIGCPPNRKGFAVLSEAIAITAEFPDRVQNMKSVLFPQVAKALNRPYKSFEIYWDQSRACIDIIFKKCSQQKLEELFGCQIDSATGKPSVSHFIGTLGQVIDEETNKLRGDY